MAEGFARAMAEIGVELINAKDLQALYNTDEMLRAVVAPLYACDALPIILNEMVARNMGLEVFREMTRHFICVGAG